MCFQFVSGYNTACEMLEAYIHVVRFLSVTTDAVIFIRGVECLHHCLPLGYHANILETQLYNAHVCVSVSLLSTIRGLRAGRCFWTYHLPVSEAERGDDKRQF